MEATVVESVMFAKATLFSRSFYWRQIIHMTFYRHHISKDYYILKRRRDEISSITVEKRLDLHIIINLFVAVLKILFFSLSCKICCLLMQLLTRLQPAHVKASSLDSLCSVYSGGALPAIHPPTTA